MNGEYVRSHVIQSCHDCDNIKWSIIITRIIMGMVEQITEVPKDLLIVSITHIVSQPYA